jgi:hypothetical protein
MRGKRFGRLLVLRERDNIVGDGRARWLCKCDCGKLHEAFGYNLRQGGVLSCGCLQIERSGRPTEHGLTDSREYSSWKSMLQRCTNPKAPDYSRYGGKGITVCDRWKDFKNFLADMGNRPHDHVLDRINNKGNYEPSNCRWATYSESNLNK